MILWNKIFLEKNTFEVFVTRCTKIFILTLAVHRFLANLRIETNLFTWTFSKACTLRKCKEKVDFFKNYQNTRLIIIHSIQPALTIKKNSVQQSIIFITKSVWKIWQFAKVLEHLQNFPRIAFARLLCNRFNTGYNVMRWNLKQIWKYTDDLRCLVD